MPLPVTIGIPVYNEEKSIARTLQCALTQPVSQIIVSDNGSTDTTLQICEAFATKHPRIHILRQGVNKGAGHNFTACIVATTTPYFMFLGAHDMIEENHVVTLMDAIVKTTGAVGAYSDAVHIDDNGTVISKYEYFYATQLLSSSPLERLMALARHLSDGTIVHGLYDHRLLMQVFMDKNMIPCDLFLVGHMAVHGKLVRAPEIVYYRGGHRKETPSQKMTRYIDWFSLVDPFFSNPYNITQMQNLTVLRHTLLLNELYPDIRYVKGKT